MKIRLNNRNIAANIIIYIIGVVTTYFVGNYNANKHYEAACLFADIIHCMMDSESIGSEVEESYYEWTSDMDNTMNFKSLKRSDLDNYCWCY